MRGLACCVFSLCVLAWPAEAQEQAPLDAAQMCREIETARQGGADYRPGVDVHGKPVAPAELSSGFSPLAQPIVIPIELNLLERFDIDVSPDIKMDPAVAQMTIYPDGRVEYNGQEVTQRAAFVCSEERLKARGIRSNVTIRGMKSGKAKAQPPLEKQGDGQTQADAIQIDPVPVVPPQEPLWNDDVITGERQ